MFQHNDSASLHKIWCWHDVLLWGFQWSNEPCCTKHIHTNKNVLPSGQNALHCEGEWSWTEDSMKLSIHRIIKILERGLCWHWHEVASPWIKEEFVLVTTVRNKLPSYQPQHRTHFLKVSVTIIGHLNPQT